MKTQPDFLIRHKLDLSSSKIVREKEKKRQVNFRFSQDVNKNIQTLQWLRSRRREKMVSFDEESFKKAREFFKCLGPDFNETLGVDELKLPLFTFGLADNYNRLNEVIRLIDTDKSGKIDYPEYLQLIGGYTSDTKASLRQKYSEVARLFKGVINNKINGLEHTDLLNLQTILSSIRRKNIISHLKELEDNPFAHSALIQIYKTFINIEEQGAKESAEGVFHTFYPFFSPPS